MMGMTMIIGIVTEVGIFLFSEQEALTKAGTVKESLVTAGCNRMRPIAMTTLAAILTLLPLAFAIGRGSEMQQPLAIAIVSGLIVQLPLVLLVMPALYLLLGGARKATEADAVQPRLIDAATGSRVRCGRPAPNRPLSLQR